MNNSSYFFAIIWTKTILIFLTIFLLFSGNVVIQASIGFKEFSRLTQDHKMTTSSPQVVTRSILACARQCAANHTCCGYNFVHASKECIHLLEDDLIINEVEHQLGTDLFVHESYLGYFTVCTI